MQNNSFNIYFVQKQSQLKVPIFSESFFLTFYLLNNVYFCRILLSFSLLSTEDPNKLATCAKSGVLVNTR